MPTLKTYLNENNLRLAFLIIVPLLILAALLTGSLRWGNIVVGEGQYITVTGFAQEDKANELASFNVGLTSTDANKNTAVESVNKKAASIITAVINYGIPENDIKTSFFNVYQNTEWNPNTQRSTLTDWTASVNLDVILRDVSKTEEFANMLATQDISSINGPNFTLTNEQTRDIDLLSLALKDAQSKAEKLAQASGRRLGKMTNLTEVANVSGPIIFEGRGAGGGGGVPSQPGTTTLIKTVTVTYELR